MEMEKDIIEKIQELIEKANNILEEIKNNNKNINWLL